MAFEITNLNEDKGIDLITIFDQNSEIVLTNYGMRIVDWKVNGRSVVLGPDKNDNIVEYYRQNPYFFGATVGRYGGRIANGTFKLNDSTYELERNEDPHHIHGGSNGLHTQICDYEVIDDGDVVTVTYQITLKQEDDQYPGNIEGTVTHSYHLIDRKWTISYEATSTEDTLFNPMNHVYFNLNETDTTIDNHVIQNENILMYNLDDDEIVRSKDNINLNEAIGKKIMSFKDIFESQLNQISKFNGIDHPILMENEKFTISNEDLEVTLETDRPFVVVFSLNEVEWNDTNQNIKTHGGFTLEAQSIPDDIHLYGDKAPSILRKGEPFKSVTSYTISNR
ncbi:hypothetical protein [Mammaliicoccus stepanovicii]|uniref:Aldose 1-epimerase n=1 Tax=Mammaliicoccus stepanovicii TaxID=643214 RepID=A0A240A6K4_9STAP|nr:hypothetical protein [Mammaliicoccus stepanovicii]PNZ78034.1 hypothetical protein CD111_02530 [Mammaliicoccus stepanovicii]GGI39601.1 galactose mutarotase [Mammaliicoccus stepanovicii]SNV78909.1 aldose 1-epimerase [Mammaliicoccus stepanovicii]